MQFELLENDSSNSFTNSDLLKKRIKNILKGSDSLYHTSSIPRFMTESDQVGKFLVLVNFFLFLILRLILNRLSSSLKMSGIILLKDFIGVDY